jgi:hypothetical protein
MPPLEVVRRECLATVPAPPGPPPDLATRTCGGGDVCIAATDVIALAGWIDAVTAYVQQVEIACGDGKARTSATGDTVEPSKELDPCTSTSTDRAADCTHSP